MNGSTVRNAVLIALASALLLTVTVQPAVCLQTTFTFTGVEVSAVQSGEYRADTLTEANQSDVIDKQGMEFKYDEDDGSVDGHDKVILHEKDSTSNNISTSGDFTVSNLVIPEGKDFTFGIKVYKVWGIQLSDITVSLTCPDGTTKNITINSRTSGASSTGYTTFYLTSSMKAVTDISKLGDDGWFSGSSGEYTLNLEGSVALTLEFYIIFK